MAEPEREILESAERAREAEAPVKSARTADAGTELAADAAAESSPRTGAPGRPTVAAWLASLLALALLIVGGALLRVHLAERDPGFDIARPETLLKSDPGILYHLSAEVDAAGGGWPASFDANARLAFPETTDVAAGYAIGQEFLIAWARRLAPSLSLAEAWLWVSSLTAASIVLGVYLLAFAWTRRPGSALLAAAFAASTPASYRTIGFLCIREDLSLPLYALHLGCLALALAGPNENGGGRTRAALAAGLFAALAWSTWLAMGMVLAVEFALLGTGLLIGGRARLEPRAALAGLTPILLAAAAVPALRARAALVSLACVLAVALFAANLGLVRSRARAVAAGLAALLAGVLAGRVFGGADFGHVIELALAKLRFGGHLPTDPDALSFETRMLWQGPFASLDAAAIWSGLGLGVPLALAGLVRGRRGSRDAGARRGASAGEGKEVRRDRVDRRSAGDPRRVALVTACAFGAATSIASQLARLLPIPAVLAAAAIPTWLASGSGERRGGATWLRLALVLQLLLFARWTQSLELSWYRPLLRQAELAEMVVSIEEHVPPGEAILTDFMNSSALLAHAGRPMIVQAKWETSEARRRVRVFFDAFYRGTPDSLRSLARDEFRTRWLLVDRFTLGILNASRALAGLRPDEPWRPGTPAERLLARDEETLRSIPGYELVWRSSPRLRQSNGAPSDFYRLYRLVD